MINHPISYGRQYITDEDIQTVVDTLRSDYHSYHILFGDVWMWQKMAL